LRGSHPDRPLDLDEAKRPVSARRSKQPTAAEYVYFDNIAERGLSYTRPLVAVNTELGTIFVNSKGEAFAEEGSPHIQEFGGMGNTKQLDVPPGVRRLRSLGQW